jgi:hypothetical protein
MPLSEKTKNFLLAPFAISPIMRKCALPGIVGFLLFGVGVWQELDWLKIVGLVLAVPVLWAYSVIALIFVPMLVLDKIRRGKARTR